jgi:hypothetical protein
LRRAFFAGAGTQLGKSTKIEELQMQNKLHKNVVLAAAILLGSTAAQAATVNGFANGGFENVGTTTPAESWLGAASGYSLSTDARTGTYSASLMSPAFNAAVMLQNSIDDGGLAPLTAGDNPLFSFWAKGFAGTTGVANYALRYLDDGGAILADSFNVNFGGGLNENSWTEFTFNLGVVPDGATAAFLEFSQGIGPIDEELLGGQILIDDVYLGVQAVPVPAAAWLFGSALLGLGGLARKKRAA